MMEGNFFHSLKKLFDVHTLEIRHFVPWKRKDWCPFSDGYMWDSLVLTPQPSKKWWMESNLPKSCCSKDGNLHDIGGFWLRHVHKKISEQEFHDRFCWKISFSSGKSLDTKDHPHLETLPFASPPIKVRKKVRKNFEPRTNLSSPFRSASGGVKWTIDNPGSNWPFQLVKSEKLVTHPQKITAKAPENGCLEY